MRRLKLKVCGMQDPHNIRAIGALLPDFMGFIFAPSSLRCVTTQLDLSHLPASICTVGVFRDQSIEFIKERVQSFGLKAVQLHGVEDLRYMELLRAELPDILIIKAFQQNPLATDLIRSESQAPAISQDTSPVALLRWDRASQGYRHHQIHRKIPVH